MQETEATEAELDPEVGDQDPHEAEPEETEPEGDLPEGERLEAYVQSAFALLFASPEPLTEKRLAGLLDVEDAKERIGRAGLERVLEELRDRLAGSRLPIELRRIAGGLRLFTDARLAEVVQRLDRSRRIEKISHAGLETLAIVAYRQPVTKAEIEAIRGVQAGPMLRQLTDRGLITVSGRADQPGAPLLYATTPEFLDRFGLDSLDELPRDGELARD